MHVDRGWLEEGITLGQFISRRCAKTPQLQTIAQSDASHTNQCIKETRCDCETTRVVASLRQEQLGMSSSASTRPSTGPRDGDIREQRPDAALDVHSVARTSTGNNKNSTRHADRSINSSMSASRSAH